MEKLWLDGKSKLNVVRIKDPDLFPELIGNAVMVSDRVVREHWLTGAPVVCLRRDFYIHERSKLNKNGPDLSDKDLETLDGHCLVKLGTEVFSGSVLAAAVSAISAGEMTPEEKMLTAIFGRSTTERDCSLRYELGDPGVVTRVELTRSGLPVDVSCRVEVEIVVRRELRVGDALLPFDGPELTVAAIVPPSQMDYLFRRELVDVLVGPDSSLDLRGSGFVRHRPKRRWSNWFKTTGAVIRVVKKTRQVEDKQEFRSVGPYSLVSQQPMGCRPHPAQLVSWETIEALFKAGYSENVRELLTIKSDSEEGRVKAYEAVTKGQEVPLDQPWSTTRLRYVLYGLGFELKIGEGQFQIMPMTDSDRLALSRGKVKSSETFNFRTYRPEPGGIFCERIFGPAGDWECRCGKYRGTKFKGLVCEKCGVWVTNSRVRRERFGHITLAKPVIHPWLGLPMETLLVIPPDLRPLVVLDDGRWTTSDLNHLYRRVINRSQRLGKLIQLDAPPVIIENETRMLQQGVDVVIDNLACPQPVIGLEDRPLHSLKEMLAETVESIRGKRSDYSARAVVVPDSNIDKGMMAMPLPMAIQLFLPTLIRELKGTGQAETIKLAKRLLEKPTDEVRALIEQVIGQERVLVVTADNKISTLTAAIADGEVLRLNPAEAKTLSLSFSDSRLKVFVPLRKEAKEELLNSQPMADVSSNLDLDHLLASARSGNTILLTPVDRILLGIG